MDSENYNKTYKIFQYQHVHQSEVIKYNQIFEEKE